MTWYPILAHGALGWWDELIFLGVTVIFVGIVGLSWIRSRSVQPDFADEPQATQRQSPAQADETPAGSEPPDRFRLD